MDFEDPRMCMMPEPRAPATEARAPRADEHEQPEHEEENPVANGLSWIDRAHLAADAAVDGGTSADTLPGMFETMGEDAAKIWQEGPSVGAAMKGVSAIAAPLAIGGGVMDIVDGVQQYRHGDHEGGVLKTIEGGATTGSGVAGLTGLASGAGATLAPLLGAGATGMAIGQYGDEQTKKLGMYHDAKGNAESASDWAADQGVAADEWTTQHLHSKTLGTIAGLGATGLASIEGAEGAVIGAVRGAAKSVGHAAHKLWDWL